MSIALASLHGENTQMIPVSFDTLFPASSFQRVLDICMHVWGEIEQLAVSESGLLSDASLLSIDAAVGKLVYVQLCLDHMIADQTYPTDVQDLEYLERVIAALEDTYDELFNRFGEPERMICTKHVLHKVRKKLVQLNHIVSM